MLASMNRVYLDYAAAAPTLPQAVRAFTRALRAYANPSSFHEEGRRAQKILQEARTTIARMAGVKKEHVIFTSGATEANALAVEGHVRALFKKGRTPDLVELLYHEGAHASVVRVMEKLSQQGVKTRTVPTKEGQVDIKALQTMLTPQTALISLEAISPETGMRHDVRGVRTLIDSLGLATLVHVDASQLPMVESFERTRLGADLITLDAQKVGGVRGIGCLITSSGVALTSIMEGGGQEGGLRGGTESPALAASFATALTHARNTHEAFAIRASRMRTVLLTKLQKEISNLRVLGGGSHAPHILTLSLIGRDSDYLQALLDRKGFSVGTKSACESDSSEGSRMALVETGDQSLAKSTLRISWGPKTSAGDLERLGAAIIRAVRFLDSNKVE